MLLQVGRRAPDAQSDRIKCQGLQMSRSRSIVALFLHAPYALRTIGEPSSQLFHVPKDPVKPGI